MAEGAKLPIIGTAIAAWTDCIRAIGAMPVLFAIVIAILIPLNLLQLPALEMTLAGKTGFLLHLWSLIYTIVQAFVITPLAVAVHRFVLLGEIAGGYRLTTSEMRYLRFFGFSVALSVIAVIPQIVINLGVGLGTALSLVFVLLGFVLMIFMIIVMLRTLMLFPSIAVDAPSADWRNAMGDTKGHSWRVFFVLICTMVPLMAFGFLQYWLMRGGLSFGGRIVAAVVQALVGTVTISALAAMASHLYGAYAEQLGRPPNLLPNLATPA
jgi:hypothetical protein